MRNSHFRIFCLLSALCGCAPAVTRPAVEKVTPQYDVQVETMEDQANAAVNRAPTNFAVASASDDKLFWARTSLFFKQYTDSYQLKKNVVRSVPGSKSRFIYEVSRVDQPETVKYSVRCLAAGNINTSTDVLSRNAKNLSRFIREGNLELSLLER